MSRTIIYKGNSDIRKISSADWASLGITQADCLWNKANNYQQIVSDAAALYLLAFPGEFADEQGQLFGALTTGPDTDLVARIAAMGDSITAGVVVSGQGTSSPFAINSRNTNSWPFQLQSMFSDSYIVIINGGVGGDVPGGKGKIVGTSVGPGSTSVTFTLDYGMFPFGSQALYLGGYYGGNPDGKTFTGITDNGDGTYTATGLSGITNTHNVGDEVGWGMIGRLQDNILSYNPAIVLAMMGTNALGQTNDDYWIAKACKDFGTLCRLGGAECYFMEILPRSSYEDNVVKANTALRDMCFRNNYDLIKTYDYFAGSNGRFLVGGDTADGLHLTLQGIKKLTDIIDTYMQKKGLRKRPVLLAQKDIDPSSLIQASAFFNGATTAFSTGKYPTGWTFGSFFGVSILPDVEADTGAEGLGDAKWYTMSVTGANPSGNISLTKACTPAPSVGDTILITCRVKTIGLAGGAKVLFQYIDNVFNISGLNNYLGPDDDMIVMGWGIVGGTAAADIRMQFIPSTTSAVGKVKYTRPRVVNLTTGGLLL